MVISPMSHSSGELEVRTCGEHLLQKEPHTTVEIIRWFYMDGLPQYNITLAYFEKDPEGYNLRFVGERVFDPEVSQHTFLQLAEIGLRYLQSCPQGNFVVSGIDQQEEEKDFNGDYAAIAASMVRLVTRKQAQYGDSFGTAPKILALLYPDGVTLDQFGPLLTVIRILDKLKRIATDHPSNTEDAWSDIGGYSILEQAKKKNHSDKTIIE